jgi:hypothetical protein
MKIKNFDCRRFLIVAVLSALLFPCNKIYGQQFQYVTEAPKPPLLYFGLGLGVNDYGAGLIAEVPFTNHISMNANAGIGGWGWKLGGSLNYYPVDVTRGHEFSLGFSTASGLLNFTTEMPVEPDGNSTNVTFDLFRVNTVNLIYTYNVKVGKACKLGLSAGWSVSLTSDAYHITSGQTLDETGKAVMNVMQPGGLIVGIRFMIGAR